MSAEWDRLLSVLDLKPSPESGDTTLVGGNLDLDYHRLVGGQILAQFVAAALHSCPGKSVKSLHSTFVKEGLTDSPVTYKVSVRHEGRSFATTQIDAVQGDPARGERLIATATASMHVPEDGPDIQAVDPVPALLDESFERTIELLPWQARSADDLDDPAVGPPTYELWMKTPEVPEGRAECIVAYATDLTLIGTALRPVEGYDQRGNGTVFLSAVTSHTLWFHRPVRTDQWLLLRQHSPILTAGRCFGRGDLLDADGRLLVSFAQEAMMRGLQPAPPATT